MEQMRGHGELHRGRIDGGEVGLGFGFRKYQREGESSGREREQRERGQRRLKRHGLPSPRRVKEWAAGMELPCPPCSTGKKVTRIAEGSLAIF